MSLFKRILVIADRPLAPDDQALQKALDLAGKARLTVCSFIYDEVVDDGGAFSDREARQLKKRLLTRQQEMLDALLARFDHKRLQGKAVWARSVAGWVTEQLEEDRFDLVVKTGHRTEKAWYTPTDWQLLRTCQVPVYLVSARKWRAKPTVLATVDFGNRSRAQRRLDRQVLEGARALADARGAALHCAYSLPISQVMLDLELHSPHEYLKRFEKQHGEALQKLAGEYGIAPEQVHVEVGAPEKKLPSIANRLKAELVVMGTHGRKGLKGRMLGNTAERVLNVLRTDILALRP